jgi:ketosteroid isomerase-like protein
MNQSAPPDNDHSWQQEIKSLENEGRLAFLAQDVARLSQLWSDDLVVNSPINRIHHKQQVLDLLAKGVIAHASLEQDIELLHRNNDIIIVMGSELVGNDNESAILRRRFTNLWRREGVAWRLFARHANIIAND